MSQHPATTTLGAVHHHRPLTVVAVLGNSGPAGRLALLGFLPGRKVRVARVAPLGDPIAVEMDGQEISVRRAEANLIVVRECS